MCLIFVVFLKRCFAELLRSRFEEQGLLQEGSRGFEPHLTIMKLSRASKLRSQVYLQLFAYALTHSGSVTKELSSLTYNVDQPKFYKKYCLICAEPNWEWCTVYSHLWIYILTIRCFSNPLLVTKVNWCSCFSTVCVYLLLFVQQEWMSSSAFKMT